MSFLSGVVGFISGSSFVGNLVKVAALSFIAKKMSDNAVKNNNVGDTPANIDQGIRLQVKPNAAEKIPVLYGAAYFGGIINDAVMTNNNKTMFYSLTLSERTGTVISTNGPSTYVFKDVYWNDQRVIFKNDAFTVDYTVDRAGNVDRSLSGQVQIYFYAGNSATPRAPENYANNSLPAAYSLIPGWTSGTHQMNDLIFAVVRVDYNREKNVTGIGTLLFHVDNSMKLPGDVLYDYMTNSRYGAGLAAEEIKVS
jgi:hypothetical protein